MEITKFADLVDMPNVYGGVYLDPSRKQAGSEVLVARQAICGLNHKTLGYELLFRKDGVDHAEVDDPELATAEVIVNSFMEIGFDRVIGRTLAFINVSGEFILGHHCRSLPRDRVVFEILEDTVPERDLMRVLRSLRAAGYRFALDDFDFGERTRPFIPLCDYIKVDLRRVEPDCLERNIKSLRGVKLLAEKVETREEYEFCRRIGFHYFQGYYFCKPRLISGTRVSTSRIGIFRLIATLQNPDVSTRELEKIIAADLSLSYKLLQYINSAYFGLKRKVSSVGHGVRMVGTEHIRLMASLIMLTNMEEKPRELMAVSLIRAKMCELLASAKSGSDKEVFFTTGLFSTLDAFLDCPIEEAMKKLPLSDDIRAALVERQGTLGEVLQGVLDYERSNGSTATKFQPDVMRSAYLKAVCWAENLMSGLIR